MRAITLTQPWATLVVQGRKRFETRSWPTRVTGRVAIHAAKAMPAWAREAAIAFGLNPDALPRGAVVGEVTITGYGRTEALRDRLPDTEIECGDWSSGRYGWQLVDPVAYPEPVPAVGSQGFWTFAP